MIKHLKPKSEFSRNVLTLMAGTTIAQAIPIAITPILTRLYTPEDFGVLALFIAITVILGTIANARYELAITLPEHEEDAIEIAALGLLIATVFTIALVIPFVFMNNQLAIMFNNTEISLWLYFVPLVIWVIGVFNVLMFLNTRYKNYKDIATAHIYKSVAMVGTQLVLGFFKSESAGLILGQIASSVSSVYRLSKNINLKAILKKVIGLKILWIRAKRYKRFFIYMLPATLMNALSTNVIVLAIPTLFSITTLGMYSLAQRALGAPSALIGSSIGQVYLQQASEEKTKTGNVGKAFSSTLKKLIGLSLLFFLPLYFIVEEIFAFLFGDEWREAGVYAQILIPFFAVNFIGSALSCTDSIMEKQYIYAGLNVANLLAAFLLLFLCNESFNMFINCFVYFFSLNYAVYILVSYFIAHGKL